MARVPVPLIAPENRIRPLTDNHLAVVKDTSVEDLGRSMSQAGQTAFDYAAEQDRINETLDRAAVRKADNEVSRTLRERLWTGDNAFYKKEGFNALNDRPQVESDIDRLRQQYLSQFTTDRQRAMFSNVFDQRAGAELEGVARYSGQQARAEEKRQSLARITEASNDAVTYWDDPVRRETAIKTADGELEAQAASGGWSPEVLTQAKKESRSNIVGRAVEGMIDRGDVEGAQSAIAEHRGDLLPDTAAKLDGAIRTPLIERQADGIVDDLLAVGANPAPVNGETPSGSGQSTAIQTARANLTGNVLDRMVQITMHSGEGTGGQDRYSDGRVITSPKGARGRMQTMPATARDPGYGIKPSDGTLEDDARVGREKLAAMMQRYKNDPAKAWAAYNWGEGNVDGAVTKHGDNWLSFAPAETQGYVRRTMAALGGRIPIQQAPREHDMTKLLARLDEMNLPFDIEQAVRRQLTARVSLDEGLLNRDRAQAVEGAWGYVEKLGDGFTKMGQIPSELRARMTPQQRLQFEGLAERNAQPKAPETDWGSYARYSDLYATNPQAFAALNPAELRSRLGDSEFQTVMGWRRDALSNGADGGRTPKQVTHDRIRSVTNPLVTAAGIMDPPDDTKSRKKDPDAQLRHDRLVGQFQRRVEDNVEAWQRANPGKDIDDNTIRDIADRQLLRAWHDESGKRVQGYMFQFSSANGLQYAMPVAEKNQIVEAYRRRWGRKPSEQEIDHIYRYGPQGGM